MCIIFPLDTKTHLLFRKFSTSSEVPQNPNNLFLQMFAMTNGSEVDIDDMDNITSLMEQIIECISEVHTEFLQKPKFHMLLHLKEDQAHCNRSICYGQIIQEKY